MREIKWASPVEPQVAATLVPLHVGTSASRVAGVFPVRSLVGLLLELGGAVRESNIEFFGSLDDGLSTEMRTESAYLVLAETELAISPA